MPVPLLQVPAVATPKDTALNTLATLVAECLGCDNTEDFAAAIVRGLRRLTPVEDATVLHYGSGDLPDIVYREDPGARGASTMERFVQAAFLLDPYYQAATKAQRFGLFRLDELAPERFRESEYYRSWYRNCGYTDECGYLVDLGSGAFINVALGRLGRRRFSDAQRGLLQAVQPAVDSLCREHWGTHRGNSGGLRQQLHAALDGFGSSLLTERETQVINLVLHGYSTKDSARKLGIAAETAKLHRKHAYAKLKVSSQAELFYLFLDSLMGAEDYLEGDALAARHDGK